MDEAYALAQFCKALPRSAFLLSNLTKIVDEKDACNHPS